jgi:YcxB-like protein
MAKQQYRQQYQRQAYQGIKTRKYQLDVDTFVKIAMTETIKKLWWAFLVPIAIILPGLYWLRALPWLVGVAVLLLVVFLVLMYAFFKNMPSLPQGKMLFDKVFYLIDKDGIKVMVSEQEGMIVKWDMIKSIKREKGQYMVFLSPVQFFIIPEGHFTSENDAKLAEAHIRRQGLIN